MPGNLVPIFAERYQPTIDRIAQALRADPDAVLGKLIRLVQYFERASDEEGAIRDVAPTWLAEFLKMPGLAPELVFQKMVFVSTSCTEGRVNVTLVFFHGSINHEQFCGLCNGDTLLTRDDMLKFESPPRLVVFDKNNHQKWFSLNQTECKSWKILPIQTDWYDDHFLWTTERTLYRRKDKWIIVSRSYHAEVDISPDPEFEVVSPKTAAEELVKAGLVDQVPDDILSLITDKLEPPTGESELAEETEGSQKPSQIEHVFDELFGDTNARMDSQPQRMNKQKKENRELVLRAMRALPDGSTHVEIAAWIREFGERSLDVRTVGTRVRELEAEGKATGDPGNRRLTTSGQDEADQLPPLPSLDR